jgi:hypothetical protein
MRSEILRDVIAGCAGVLAVAAAIGLPRESPAAQQQQFQHTQLLPYYSHTVEPGNQVPAPHMKITTRP